MKERASKKGFEDGKAIESDDEYFTCQKYRNHFI